MHDAEGCLDPHRILPAELPNTVRVLVSVGTVDATPSAPLAALAGLANVQIKKIKKLSAL